MQPRDSDTDVALGGSWSASLEEIFDEHAELRDLIVQMQETGDIGVLGGLLERLHNLLQAHFEREEHDDGMLRMMREASPEHRRNGAVLSREHPKILAAVRELIGRVRTDEPIPLAVAEREIGSILSRLSDHDANETDLIRSITSVDASAATRARETRSKALEVNLRRTAVQVVIPEEQKVLMEVTAGFAGVSENTKKLLWEINHRYVGWAQTLEDLHRRAMGDFAHHIAHERAPEAIGVFCDLYAKISEQATPVALRETAARKFLYYLEKVVRDSGDRLPHVVPPLDAALDRMEAIFGRDPRLAALASPRVKHLAATLAAAGGEAAAGLAERSLQLLAGTLSEVYQQWLERIDPVTWWRKRTGASSDTPVPAKLAVISHSHLRECLDELVELEAEDSDGAARADTLLSLPDNARIERGYLDAANCIEAPGNTVWQNRLQRIHWLIDVLSVDGLASVHEQALSEVSHSYLDVLRSADAVHLEEVVRETFATLRRSVLATSRSGLNLISKIGLEVQATGNRELFEVVIDEILAWDFPDPDFTGFTDDWRVQVDPAHLRAIRTYLSLIEGNPEFCRPLIAALVVHLRVGGVFIADTDLFQKDISRLLNSGIGPVYHQIIHLLKIFPVYFSDIGAEGELRDVSSHIDEIRGRKDPLCHFLRKQCHVESNPFVIRLIEEIGRFWATGDVDGLRPYVPPALLEGLDVADDEYAGLHAVFAELTAGDEVEALFQLDVEAVEERVRRSQAGRALDREKVVLLFKLRRLMGRKYELDHDDLLERLSVANVVSSHEHARLRSALESGECQEALTILLDVLERLKKVVTSDEKTEGYEDVYHKRHIAAGIPSMYGRYREEKFEAIGLSFRIESMANALFERLFAEARLEFVTRNTLLKVADWLRLILRALRVDGSRGRGLATGTAMLDQALLAEGFRVDQFINIFQLLSRSVENLIRIRFIDVYENALERIVHDMLERGQLPGDESGGTQETVLKVSESFFRDLIAASFGLQQLDNLIGKVLRMMVQSRDRFDRNTLGLIMSYDAERSFVEISPEVGPHDGAIYMGNKGYAIKRLAHDGLPVPDGFILTTEVFRSHEAIRRCEELRREVHDQIRRKIERLESRCDAKFADPDNPLLLSVRSGAAISMPGILDTFLNVGISVEVAEGFARRSGSPWAAWDAYRRFVQGWGMGHGISRDGFDALMRAAKQEVGIAKKSGFEPEKMRDLALRYRDYVLDNGVEIPADPYEQLFTCIDLVLDSWHSETAQSYRSAVQIAAEWGTAVVVQNMVYGNLSKRSGTGVVLTCDPRRTSGDVRLHGDFIAQGQGDDVVSGLVETFPISEKQRLTEAKGGDLSLEKDFPAIFEALNRHACALIYRHGMFHQEIEFTFESEQPEDLFILQTRDAVLSQETMVPAFIPSEKLDSAKVATGIGVAGGALSGRVAHTIEDITNLRGQHPEDAILLLRPDTVPEDIPLILRTDGMVTAIGGATSHAALVAQRVGRTCVVGCRQLEVFDDQRRSQLAGRTVSTGDFISINGSDGSVYLGKHPSTTVRRQRLT
ncbi:MAG: PEP/pyruvate-binding domain-containing protein [Myxococcota bacterium]